MCITKSVLFLFLLAYASGKVIISTREAASNFNFSTAEHVASFGYPIEVHRDLETEDGYLLTLHRIPYGLKNTTRKRNRPVVFLNHGMGGAADSWVIMGPEMGLGFLLADRGYDVWMGNARGSFHSRKHTKLQADLDSAYWDFSWHEIGFYDLPASFKYILKLTGQRKLVYVGHSQGGTTFYVMATTRPEMNDVVKLSVGLAPGVCYGFEGVTLDQKVASYVFEMLENVRRLTGLTEVGAEFRQIICNMPVFSEEICHGIVLAFSLMIADRAQLTSAHIEAAKHFRPNAVAIRQALHYVQVFLTADFRQYDFGAAKNMRKYGREVPPSYDLKLATAPAALFQGPMDILVTPPNVDRLERILPNVVLNYVVPFPSFDHLDFIIARDIVELVYSKVFEVMEQFSEK